MSRTRDLRPAVRFQDSSAGLGELISRSWLAPKKRSMRKRSQRVTTVPASEIRHRWFRQCYVSERRCCLTVVREVPNMERALWAVNAATRLINTRATAAATRPTRTSGCAAAGAPGTLFPVSESWSGICPRFKKGGGGCALFRGPFRPQRCWLIARRPALGEARLAMPLSGLFIACTADRSKTKAYRSHFCTRSPRFRLPSPPTGIA